MAAGERARNPAHLPSEALVEFVRVREIAIREEDHNHADGEGCEDDEGKEPAG